MSVGQYVNLLLGRLKFFENFDWKTSTSFCIQIEGEEKTIILTKVAENNTKRYEEDAADDHAVSIDVTPVKDDQQQDDSNRLATTFAIRSGATTVNLICHL